MCICIYMCVYIYGHIFLFKVVNTLALFLTPNERACSKYANGLGDLKYERDLFLQGLVRVSI